MKLLPVCVLFAVVINLINTPVIMAKNRGKQELTKYVNPIIGTAKTTTINGLRFGGGSEQNAQVQPSVTVPFGMTNWTPQTHNSEKKCLSSYYYKDSIITGFRGSHWLSGSCTQEYGSMAVMPVLGNFIADPKKRGSFFRHSDEITTPYYYKVYLQDYDIVAEMSATTRCGILKFTFNKEGIAHLAVSPNTDEGEGVIHVFPEKSEITGSNPIRRIYQGWGKLAGFSGHFVVKVKKQQSGYGIYSENNIVEKGEFVENKLNPGGFLSFKVKKGETVYVKVGTSFVSIDQARKNLDAEIPGFDFDRVVSKLKKEWEGNLARIIVDGNSDEDKVKFYTAMYHSMQQPRIYNDVDGSYPRFDGNARTDTIKGGNYYCDFSIWDTYRALHPLYNILFPKQQADMVKSLLIMAKAGGWLPIFPKWNSYTAAMIGDHAIALIAESYLKGVVDLTEEDYQILKKNATKSPVDFKEYSDGKGRRALTYYLKYGYIPLEDSVKEAFHKCEQVSRTLEYAYDDYALALVAKKMGKQADYEYFLQRSKNYKNVFDPAFKNMNGRYADGSFYKELKKNDFSYFITEGTAWQYNWYVPQDVEGLAALMGGWKAFSDSLDEFFAAGQYWHGNEPGHQIPFLYNYAAKPSKTQKIVSEIMKDEYGTGPGGLSGNDDAGQMSAWYILGALGFYPVSPVSGDFQISGPKFKKIIMKLENGKIFEINAPDYSNKNIYIEKILLNGKEYNSYSFPYEQLMKGGKMYFKMTEKTGK